jgi:hypothetical protein
VWEDHYDYSDDYDAARLGLRYYDAEVRRLGPPAMDKVANRDV